MSIYGIIVSMRSRHVKQWSVASNIIRRKAPRELLFFECLPVDKWLSNQPKPAVYFVLNTPLEDDGIEIPIEHFIAILLKESNRPLADSMASACEALNKKIADYCKERGASWIEKTNGALIAIDGKNLVLSCVGPIKAFLNHGDKMIELTSQLPTEDRRPSPFCLFSSIIEGEIKNEARIAIINEAFTKQITKNKLRQTLRGKDFKQAAKKLEKDISKKDETVYALFLELSTKGTPDTAFELFEETPTLFERPKSRWKIKGCQMLPGHKRRAVTLTILASALFITSIVGLSITKHTRIQAKEKETRYDQIEIALSGAEEVKEKPFIQFDEIEIGRLAALGNNLAVIDLEKGALIYYNDSGSALSTLKLSTGPLCSAASGDEVLFLLDRNSILHTLPPNETSPVKLGKITGKEVAFYGDRIYAMSVENKQIYRYDLKNKNTKLDKETPWLRGTRLPDSALSLTVDGDIYVSAFNNVLAFFKGEPKPFTPDIPKGEHLFAKIWTSQDSPHLFVLDAETNSILVFEKENSSFLRQFTLQDKLDSLNDFAVNLKEKKLFVLTNNGVWKFDIQNP